MDQLMKKFKVIEDVRLPSSMSLVRKDSIVKTTKRIFLKYFNKTLYTM